MGRALCGHREQLPYDIETVLVHHPVSLLRPRLDKVHPEFLKALDFFGTVFVKKTAVLQYCVDIGGSSPTLVDWNAGHHILVCPTMCFADLE